MIRKRFHKLRYKEVVSTGGYRDDFGDWIEGETIETTVTLSCRADVNSAGKTVKNHEWQDFVYSFEIFLDNIPDTLKRRMEVEILKGEKVILTAEVIMPFEFQHHGRIWV